MAVVRRPGYERFRSISATEASNSGMMLGNSCLKQSMSVYFQVQEPPSWLSQRYFTVGGAVERGRVYHPSCLIQHCDRIMAFEDVMEVVPEIWPCEGEEFFGGPNEEADLLGCFFADDDVGNFLQVAFAIALAVLLNVGRRISSGSIIFPSVTVIKLGSDGCDLAIAGEEIDGDRDDRQKRKQTDSKNQGGKGKDSRSEGGSATSGACGTDDCGSSGDDGGDDGEEGGRRETIGGPQSATDEAMEEDEEKEDSEELETVENLDITGVPGFMPPVPPKETKEEADQRRADEERERDQARRRQEAEARAAAAEAAAAAAAAVAAAAAAAAAAEGSDDEAEAGPSRSVSKTDEEDPEEVRKMSASPETPSEGTPSQSPTPPPDVTEATDASDL